MKEHFSMDCRAVMDNLCLSDNLSDKADFLPLFTRLRIEIHLLFCPNCARELKNLRQLEAVMKTDFFPPCPDFEEPVMERLLEEIGEEIGVEGKNDAPAGFSLRGWVLIGFFMLLSLSSSFFGISFGEIANKEGLSFLLPVGITIGIVLTCYGALFIASHLKELSSRFGLR